MNKFFRILPVALVGALVVPALFATSNVAEVNAATPPSTIILKDSTPSEIQAYYNNLVNKTSSELSGDNLLKNLKPILKKDQTCYSYGSSATTAVWQAYEILDRDWVKSPASAIEGYNSTTETITGYTYGQSLSNPGSDPYVHALYVNRTAENNTKAWGSTHDQKAYGINQEHVWAKSLGFDDKSKATGARGDLQHLWAGNGVVNGMYHKAYYYGYVDKTKSYSDAKDNQTYLSGNLSGYSKTLGGSRTVFEPQDSDKGDIARIIFYMAARYNHFEGDTDTVDASNPNLKLVNDLTSWASSGYTSSATNPGKMGILQDLLEWNRIDPPDTWEIHRNNINFKNFAHNRNPFVDYPEWAEYIWGKSVNGNYSPTSTGSANPNSDTLNGFSDGPTPEVTHVTSVTLNKESTSIEVGATETLTATVLPADATDKSLTWTSSRPAVATVSSSGVVTGITDGKATITATSNDDSSKTASCLVTVGNGGGGGETTYEQLTSIASIDESADYVLGIEGTGFHYQGTSGWGNVALPTEQTPLYYSLTKNSGGQSFTASTTINSTTYYLQVPETNTFSMATSSGTNTDLIIGTTLVSDTNYAVANATTTARHLRYNTSTTNSGLRSYASTTGTMAFFYKVVNDTPVAPTLESITLDTTNVQTSYTVGDTFSSNGLVVTAHYSDESSKEVTPTSISSPDMSTDGVKEITVTYVEDETEVEASFEIDVEPIPVYLVSISVSGQTTSFDVGDDFEFGGTVTALYSDDSEIDVTGFAEFSGYDMDVAGNQTVTVTYSEDEIETSTTYQINVKNGGSPIYEIITAEKSVAVYATENSWNNNSRYTSMAIDSNITAAVTHGSAHSGKYISTGYTWRYYQSDSGEITISCSNDYVLDSIEFTYSVSSTAILLDSNNELVESDTKITVSGTSVSYHVANSDPNVSNGHIRFSNFIVKYHELGGEITSISATVNKTYKVGETISKDDIVVRANTDAIITDFSFANDGYQFTYQDAQSGGAETNKVFENAITASTLSCSLTVKVIREASEAVEDQTTALGYTEFYDAYGKRSGTDYPIGGVDFTCTANAYTYHGQLSFGKDAGYIYNTNATSTPLKSFSFVESSSSRGDGAGYVSKTGLANSWVPYYDGICDADDYYFFRIEFVGSSESYSNITDLTFVCKAPETPVNLANYIMFEDTENQCETKFEIAEDRFYNLTVANRDEFMSSNDYVIKEARTRLQAWARNQGKEIAQENNTWIFKNIKAGPVTFNTVSDAMVPILVIFACLSTGAILTYVLIKKKKSQI